MKKKGRNVKGGASAVERNYKDTIFRMLFQDPKNLLSLYNAVNGTSYSDSDELIIVTLKNAIYMNMKNDLAFILNSELNLYEHQATMNPNLPLRNLFYVSRAYQNLVALKTLYSSMLVKIPTPEFIVFYNGAANAEERTVRRLSDAFEIPTDDPNLELQVTYLNINAGFNESLKETCQTLKEYMQYVDRVRLYADRMELPKAVETAVDQCIKEGILKDFLIRNRAEAIEVSIFEYDEVKEKELIRQAEYQVGKDDGIREGLEQGKHEQLKNKVYIKLRKGKNSQQIADELEEDLSVIIDLIQEICEEETDC